MDATAVSDESDRDLLARWCEARDHGAFAALVERHRPLVAAVCRRELRDPAEIDDVAQEVFIALAEEASSIRGSPGAWLRTVALHRSLNHVRARQRRRQHEQRGSVGVATAEAAVDDAEEDLLTACLAEIDPGERDLLVQLFFLGHSQAEVARSSRVSALVVHRRLKRALASLRERFARRGRRLGPAALLLLLAGGDRALAAVAGGAAGGGAALGWGLAAAVVVAGFAAVLAPSLGKRRPDPPPMVSPAHPSQTPPLVDLAAPAATQAADDGWGRPPADPDSASPATWIDGAKLQWEAADTLRVMTIPLGSRPEGGIDDWLERSESLVASRYATPIIMSGPAILRLPPRAWRLEPPAGQALVVYHSDRWRDEAGNGQVMVTVHELTGVQDPLAWMVVRQARVRNPDEPGLWSVVDCLCLGRDGEERRPGERQWHLRPPLPFVRYAILRSPAILAGWALQPLGAEAARALRACCTSTSGAMRIGM